MPELPGRNLQARYNICPTTTIDAVIERDANRELVPMRWGPADQVPVNTPDSMMRWH
jgi:putative SOS response-associated peptidase YedK